MALTNKYNIPSPLPEIVAEGGHAPRPNRYSVTDLIEPPLIRSLKLKHYEEMSSDVSDYLYMLLGTAVDKLLTDNLKADSSCLVQHKMTYEIEGCTIVGVADVIQGDKVSDWKVTSTSVLTNENRINKYVEQLNIYAFLRNHEREVPVRNIEIQAYLRDWVKSKTMTKGYPRCQWATLPLRHRLMSFPEQEEFVMNRLLDHLHNPMRECTPAEKWQKETTYAVKKEGRKSAMRVLGSERDAFQWIEQNVKPELASKISVERRPGGCPRCTSYCSVSRFCPYNKED